MTEQLTAAAFFARLEALTSPLEKEKYNRYFKLGPGEYGEGDIFMGVRMGEVFALAKAFIVMPLDEIEILMENTFHEMRLGAMSIMDKQARSKKTSPEQRAELYNLYLRRHDRINSWDLVDLAAQHVVGGFLFDKPRGALYQLARSSNMWERRTAVVSTFYFVRNNQLDDTFAVADILINDVQDLVNRATGWALRTAGEVNRARLLSFLDAHAASMPRTTLRYSMEHLEKDQRSHYLSLKRSA